MDDPKPLMVMVADDDEDLRALVVATLRSVGHLTIEARDGGELLEMLGRAVDDAAVRPDVLITDLKMPKMSGLGVLETLRSAHWYLPVVIMTVFTDESIHEVARKLGAVGVLRKPFDPDDLLTAVRNAKAATDLRCPKHVD